MTRTGMGSENFEEAVTLYYEGLYRFALSLSRTETEASDLTQETFYRLAAKGHQLRNPAKLKSWLFTTLHREFLGSRRRQTRFAHHEIGSVEHELSAIPPNTVDHLDGATVMQALMQVDELYRVPLTLFYVEDHSYAEIAEILAIPIGTVMSRLARGKALLRQSLTEKTEVSRKILPLPQSQPPARTRHEQPGS